MNTTNWKMEGNAEDIPEIGRGNTLLFRAIHVRNTPTDVFSTITNPEGLDGVFLVVCFYDGAKLQIEGSAVVVGPATALTAAHVVSPRVELLLAGGEVPFCMSITDHGTQYWDIKHLKVFKDVDLALLSLIPRFSLPENKRLFRTKLTTRLPHIGEDIEIYGFRAIEEFDREMNAWFGHFVLSHGKVTKIYPDGRDSVMMPWPCIEVDCPTLGGTSGGPAFGEDGRLIGVLSTSFSSTEHVGPSYVSLLWRALVEPFDTAWPKELVGEKGSILDRNGRGFTIDRPENIELLPASTPSSTAFHVKFWTREGSQNGDA